MNKFFSIVLLIFLVNPAIAADKEVIDELASRGHKINYPAPIIGGGQIILIDTNQELLIGASDWRKDGCAIGY